MGNSSKNTEVYGYIELKEDIILEQLKNIVTKPEFEDFKPNNIIYNENLNNYKSIILTKDDFTFRKINYTYIASVSTKLLNSSDNDLINMCLGNYKENNTEFFNEREQGFAGTTTKKIKSQKNYLTMADGPAGLRLSKAYGIDEKGFFHRMDENLVEANSYRYFMNQKNIILMKNTTANINMTQYKKIEFQYPIAIPIETALAQSFNLNLVKNIGKIISKQMKKFNVDIWLAPALNIHRNILCGRNFEYFSEDPYVSGMMAGALVQGVQSLKKKGATIKHYAANNQEFNRLNSNSQISERALREIYLRGFKIAIEKSNPLGLMTSYNLLNGFHTSENFNLIIDVLRNEWNYKGLIMTDWSVSGRKQFLKSKYPAQNAYNIIKAGVDIMMPGNRRDYLILEKKWNETLLKKEDLLRCAGKVYEITKLIKN